MPTTFNKEGTGQCFGIGCEQPPAYRVITLTADGTVEGELSVELAYHSCAGNAS